MRVTRTPLPEKNCRSAGRSSRAVGLVSRSMPRSATSAGTERVHVDGRGAVERDVELFVVLVLLRKDGATAGRDAGTMRP